MRGIADCAASTAADDAPTDTRMRTRGKQWKPLPGCVKRSTTRGRPREQFRAEVVSSYISNLNDGDIDQQGSASLQQCWFKSSCSNPKHLRYLACHTLQSTRIDSLQCKICNQLGHKHKTVAYKVVDNCKLVSHFATEAFVLKGEYNYQGTDFSLIRHGWDIAVPEPLKDLVEVQGEDYDSKLNFPAQRRGQKLSGRALRDTALAAAAVDKGWRVVWLRLGPEEGREKRWAELVQQAVQDAADGKKPQLYR